MEPSRNWKEIIARREEEHFRELAGRLVRLQQMHAVNGQVGRALHNQQLGGFEAKLEVFGDIPEYGRYGLFVQPRLYDAVVRYSNGASNVDSDQTPDVRGMAVKVRCGTGAVQDLLAVLQPHSPFRNADEFVGVIWAARNKLLALPRIFWAVGFRMFPILIAFRKSISPPPQSVPAENAVGLGIVGVTGLRG